MNNQYTCFPWARRKSFLTGYPKWDLFSVDGLLIAVISKNEKNYRCSIYVGEKAKSKTFVAYHLHDAHSIVKNYVDYKIVDEKWRALT